MALHSDGQRAAWKDVTTAVATVDSKAARWAVGWVEKTVGSRG